MSSDTAVSILLALMDEIDRGEMPGHTKFKLKEFISASCSAAGIVEVEKVLRVQYARRLLDERIDRATVRERLMARFGIQRSQAYREIRSALNLCHRPPEFGTAPAQNDFT